MKHFTQRLRKFEFEARIFISFSIVLVAVFLSFLVFASSADNFVVIGNWFGADQMTSLRIGYLFVVILMIGASVIRMWAGSVLSSQRMMAFHIQNDKFTTVGPYLLVRNPIYLADLIAFFGFALCLKPIGIVLPVLLFLHYTQLVIYEEQTLEKQFKKKFQTYKSNVPRFIPDIRSLGRLSSAVKDFYINRDGFRHNALYILFIPGFIVSSFSGSLILAITIGLPAVLDWAIVHTRKGIAPEVSKEKTASGNDGKGLLSQKKIFEDIIYAQCWEDPDIDREAFKICSDDVVFSITSGGCNVLTFLVDNPRKIIALDLNPCQNALLELKMAAFKIHDYKDLLEFLGVTRSTRRLELYKHLRPHLSCESRDYWDTQTAKIESGILHCGRYEGYMHLLGKWFCRIMGKHLAAELFATNGKAERARLYAKKWNNLRWRFFTRVLLSRTVMTKLFDKAFFAQLGDSFSFGEHFRKIIRNAVVELPLRDNTFLAYILFGNYLDLKHLPVYLREENFDVIRSRLTRIERVCSSCEDYFATLPSNSISRFNFTNIFEWMLTENFEKLMHEIVRVAKNGAIITYRNLLVPRSRPDSVARWIEPQKDLSAALHRRDLSFIYKAYVVERIRK
jgi:S-adenosylmethionine-diacylglycerol 3-amino-3-carboxypropyl transferase